MDKSIDQRPRNCVTCGRTLILSSVTSPHPGAPEMLRLPTGAWIGIVAGDVAPEMIVACSEPCVQRLLRL